MKTIESKIYKREDLAVIINSKRKTGQKIGVTNGVFDILHTGHVFYLEEAKKRCDILIVSINTDESVKTYKNNGRPIIEEHDRANLVAALESVDYVTFHNERRMRTTLELLKPDYYIKAENYTLNDLTSKNVLKKWGGEVILIPLIKGKSTTIIIQNIVNTYCNLPISIDLKHDILKRHKAVFLDRDGVINEDIEYLHEVKKLKYTGGALEGLLNIQKMGFKIVIITTQAGIGLGYFTKEDFFKVNKAMLQKFSEYGIVASKIYFCPHSVSENCFCRKPQIGLIEKARVDLNLDLNNSWMIGDKSSDILAGKKAGCHTIMVNSTNTGIDKIFPRPDFKALNLTDAAEIIQKNL